MAMTLTIRGFRVAITLKVWGLGFKQTKHGASLPGLGFGVQGLGFGVYRICLWSTFRTPRRLQNEKGTAENIKDFRQKMAQAKTRIWPRVSYV